MKERVVKVCLCLIFIIITSSACSGTENTDILFIRHHLDEYDAHTFPYEKGVKFTLTTEDILNGMEEEKLIDQVRDTKVYLMKVEERENRYIIQIGLNSELKSEGTMLSLFRLNPDGSHSRQLTFQTYNEKGDRGEFGHGGGDGESPYEQSFHFDTDEEALLEGKRWTFKVSGLYLLNYSES